MKKINISLVIVAVMVLGSSCSSNYNNSSETVKSSTSINTNAINSSSQSDVTKHENFLVIIGKYYSVTGEYLLKAEPLFSDAQLVLKTSKDKEYIVEEIEGKFAKIKSEDVAGWIPMWYLTDEESKVISCKPYVMIVNELTELCLYPEEESPDFGDSVNYGTVVQVVKKYKDWYNVNFVHYEAANWGDRWIRSDALIEYNPEIATEGCIKEGAKIYNEKFELTKDENYDNANVRISTGIEDSKGNTYYRFNGIAGTTGFIKKDDFIPNPFK